MDKDEIKEQGREAAEQGDKAGPEEAPEKGEEPRVFVVGLGQTGRKLIFRIMNNVPVQVGLDIDQRKMEAAARRVSETDVKLHLKDGTSRLAWEELGLTDRDTVVCVTRRDEVNLETCRITRKHFGVKRLLALMHSSGHIDEYSEAGVEVVSRAEVLASFFESRVLRDRRTATTIGLGQGEIIEVPVLAGSPVIGRPLSTFHARPWLVGAIYRKDKLIVPHGHTVIREGDRVVLIGEPHILSGIADFFKMGEPEFPLQYGPRIGVLPGQTKGKVYQDLLSESNYLARNTKAISMAVLSIPDLPEPDLDQAEKICGGTDLSCEPAYLPDEEHKPWPRLLQTQDFGCLVMSCGRFSLFRRLGIVSSLLMKVLEDSDFPVLVSRGTHPYEKILVPVEPESSTLRAVELAINLARQFKARLDAVTVTEPAFAAGHEAVEEQKRILDRVVEHSALYRHAINIVHREGNPIKETVEQAGDADLVVMGYRRRSRGLIPRLDMGLEILARLSCSAMILPYSGEEE